MIVSNLGNWATGNLGHWELGPLGTWAFNGPTPRTRCPSSQWPKFQVAQDPNGPGSQWPRIPMAQVHTADHINVSNIAHKDRFLKPPSPPTLNTFEKIKPGKARHHSGHLCSAWESALVMQTHFVSIFSSWSLFENYYHISFADIYLSFVLNKMMV